MIRLLGPGGLIVLALWVYAALDVIATDDILVRNLPKSVWILLVLFVPPLGPIAWLILGRPQYVGWAPGGGSASGVTPPGTRSARPRGIEDHVAWTGADAPAKPATTSPEERELFEKWEDDLARREADLRSRDEGRPTAPKRPEPAPRWWHVDLDHPAHSLAVGSGLVVVAGPERASALDASGEVLWTTDPVHDDGRGVVTIEAARIAYWAEHDAVVIDPATGELVDVLDEPRPDVGAREGRIVVNDWVVDCSEGRLRVKTPDGRQWTMVGGAEVCPHPQVGDGWVYWASREGRVHAVDTTIKTPVTAVQSIGLTLR